MNFNWSDDQAQYRARVRTFIQENLPYNWEQLAHGPGSREQTDFSKVFSASLQRPACLSPIGQKRGVAMTRVPGACLSWPRKCGWPVSLGAAST